MIDSTVAFDGFKIMFSVEPLDRTEWQTNLYTHNGSIRLQSPVT